MKERHLARSLAWLGIGLGTAAILNPRKLSQSLGVEGHHNLVRLIALREIACGIAILNEREPGSWLQARAAGDFADIGLIGAALTQRRADRRRLATAAAVLSGKAALDLYVSRRFGRARRHRAEDRVRVPRNALKQSIIINRSPEELFLLWRNFENLPSFMSHLKSVEILSETRSHWIARVPGRREIEWDAEIVEERPNELIAWRSTEDSDLSHTGSVEFEPAPGGRGTIIRVNLHYDAPGGILGNALAKMMGKAPEKQIKLDLRRLKQLLETGEIARTRGQPTGRPIRRALHKLDEIIQSPVTA